MFLKNLNKLFLIPVIFLCSCSSGPIRDDLMEDYGIVCPGTDIVKKSKLDKKITIDGKDCVKIKMDKDPASDYYLREWEKENLPEMPDLP